MDGEGEPDHARADALGGEAEAGAFARDAETGDSGRVGGVLLAALPAGGMTSALEVLTNGLPECASAWPSVSIAVRSRRIMSSGSAKSPPKAMCRTPSAVSAPPRSLSRSVKRGPGPSIERARAIGHLAMTAARDLDHDAAMHLWRSVLPLSVWPEGDLRITSVRCETGETVLWTRSDGIDLPTAVASSCAVPGFLPPVPFGGAPASPAPPHWPRRRTSTPSSSSALAREHSPTWPKTRNSTSSNDRDYAS
ncbi:hypothetical protein [Streptomyces hygroscopicus]|uniref:hypothetical protein n=1 Tax=Streptomyces hygroscopicus TaxID=1912 RepID=UPI00131B1016|nr:hypothetical protein [Streptomyces hygroscopicus]